MIQYMLVCENEHRFEAWFRNGDAFDEQVEMGIVTCPMCMSVNVSKALMAPAVGRKTNADSTSPAALPEEAESPAAPAGTPEKTVSVSLGHPDQKKLVEVMRALRDKVTSEADYVGKEFAAEARKIHYHEAEPRGIYGEATAEETASLIEDGIDILPLPSLPEEQN